jgi:hypothetical protein
MAIHPALEARAVPPTYVSGDWGDRYVAFQQGDWAGFTRLHSHPEPTYHRRVVAQSGGLIVNRWDIDGPLVPYVRPDAAVQLDSRSPKRTKYIQPKRYPDQAKRIDVHPLVRERLIQGTDDPIYFCLEGCFKADAIAGTGRLAISVPSVTLWRVKDEHLAPWLPILRRSRAVFVVPDSDFLRLPGYGPDGEPRFINQNVRSQTGAAVGELQALDVRARYAVPPYLLPEDALLLGVSPADTMKRGVDDYVAQGGDFSRWTPDNPQGIHYYGGRVSDWRLPKKVHHSQGDPRDTAFIAHLERSREREGTFGIGQVSRELKWTRKRVTRAWQSCSDRGVLRVWEGWPLGEGKGNKAHVFRFVIEEA